MPGMEMGGADASAVAAVEEGGSTNGDISHMPGVELEFLAESDFTPVAADIEGGPGPDDYTHNPDFQASFVA